MKSRRRNSFELRGYAGCLHRVVLDRSRENVIGFMTEQAKRTLSDAEIVTGLKLLELQRYLMLMYTSCGWFFDDLSGLETVQVIQYAGRALQLAGQLFSEDLATPFLDFLAQARSNLPDQGDGRSIYEHYVQPAMVDLEKVGAHYAVSSLFEEYGQKFANLLLRHRSGWNTVRRARESCGWFWDRPT